MRHRLAALISRLLPCSLRVGAFHGPRVPLPQAGGGNQERGHDEGGPSPKMFGEPTQVGMKDGDQTWTWYYFKKGTGRARDMSKQLEVTFNAQGVVKSYSFSSNFPEDMKTR